MKLKKDEFSFNRGGYSRKLEIRCRKCEKVVATYQKDGPGNLRRMYLDRILETSLPKNKRFFTCTCKEILGMKVLYKKENRPAFRLFLDAVTKKIIKT